jgi:CheY-like chemotaxis protein
MQEDCIFNPKTADFKRLAAMKQNYLRIILVDDDEDDRFLFKDAVEEMDAGIHLNTVTACEELMELLHASAGDALPDIIFLDLNMPGQNGQECLEEIRRHHKLRNIPVAIYSTSNSQRDIQETFHKGANLYIQKPREFDQLKKVISEVISINWKQNGRPASVDRFFMNP